MRSRELSGTNQEFQKFAKDMETAVEAMGPAAEKLRGLQWKDALAPEQKALQYLLRAESTFRQIQVAFGAARRRRRWRRRGRPRSRQPVRPGTGHREEPV